MTDRPLLDWSWIGAHLAQIAGRVAQHLQLAAIAVVAGFVIAFLLAIWTIHDRRVYGPVTALTGILYTVPSLAAFAALVPITGLSLFTAEIPLTAYTLLILVRNNVAGFDSVPADVLEAAEAMGYGRWTRLRRIELPLALPLIVAGLRIASVSTIGLVTIAATIGDRFGGLGVLITEGLQTFFFTKIYVGAGLSVLLAVAVDVAFVLVLRAVTPWTRVRAVRATAAGASVD